MPVTKKKGAIFAVYADSPPARTSGSSSSASTSRARPPSSPTKRTSSRSALTALQPTSARGFPSAGGAKAPLADKPCSLAGTKNTSPSTSSASSGKAVLGEKKQPLAQSSAAQASRTKLGRENSNGGLGLGGLGGGLGSAPLKDKRRSTTSTTTLRPVSSSKRAFEIYSDSTATGEAPAKPSSSCKPAAAVFGTSASTSTSASLRGPAPAPLAGPSTPARNKRAASPLDKENLPAIGGSPASRTRSKVRSSASLLASARALALKQEKSSSKLGGSSVKRSTVRRVEADLPLADVSEAYGATIADEPAGFRTGSSVLQVYDDNEEGVEQEQRAHDRRDDSRQA